MGECIHHRRWDFNPRSHKGSDKVCCQPIPVHIISIHAPTRGATINRTLQPCIAANFNPRSHKGSDGSLIMISKQFMNFNPRSHKGSDIARSSFLLFKIISIHAPTRGATDTARQVLRIPQYFNPRSHKGSDGSSPVPCITGKNFNPRSHKGSDGLYWQHCQAVTNFNPRSHKGSDKDAGTPLIMVLVFQSTLPQGERQQFYTKFHICFISFLPILSPYHISTHSPLPTFNHFLYIFSGANRPEISCLLPFRTKTISGIL